MAREVIMKARKITHANLFAPATENMRIVQVYSGTILVQACFVAKKKYPHFNARASFRYSMQSYS